MEIKSSSPFSPEPRPFVELVQRFIRLRPSLILPEPAVRFKQQVIESLQSSQMGGAEDYHFVIRTLLLLAQCQQPPTMGELSANLNIPFSSATRIIDWLVQGHFVERLSDPSDRRIVRVHMTATGQQLYQAFLDHIEQRIAHLLVNFSAEEQADLLRLLKKLLDSLLEDQ